MLQYKASTADLTIEELLELRGILGRGRPPWVEALALEQLDKQAATDARLLAQGNMHLGGEGDLWRERKDSIDAWWARLKEKERAETWEAVFAANRMSARQIGSSW